MTQATGSAAIPALPIGTRLVHIGPPKTGTTTLQAAFDRSRDAVLAQGVRYAGRRRHSRDAVIATTSTGPGSGGGSHRGRREWQAIVREIRAAREDHVLFSSERLSHAQPDAIRRIVDELDGDVVHVVVTLRPISRILPSQWQQGVQSGLVTTLDDWLQDALASDPDDPRSVWYRQRHDRLVERWAQVVGVERLSVIVADDRDRTMLLRVFERLLALRDHTLQVHRDMSNRSLTRPEVEAMRALNIRLKADGVPAEVHHRFVERGAAVRIRLRDPDPEEPSIVAPAWAALELARIERDVVAGLRRSGVRMIGDVDGLAPPPRGATAEAMQPCISPATAAALATGLLVAGSALGGTTTSAGRPASAAPTMDLGRVPTRRLAGVVARRLGRMAVRRSRGLVRAIARR